MIHASISNPSKVRFRSYLLSVDLDVCDVVLEHGGHVHFRELILGEDDEQAGLAAGAVAHDHQLLADGRHRRLKRPHLCDDRVNRLCGETQRNLQERRNNVN